MKATLTIDTVADDVSYGPDNYQRLKRNAIVNAIWDLRGLDRKDLALIGNELVRRAEED
jgi:hypothetical protein